MPAAVVVLVVALVLVATDRVLARRAAVRGSTFARQVTMLALTGAGVLVLVLALPIEKELKQDLLALIGLLLSAAIALSATTFVGNALAGVMMRAVRNFEVGDFLRVGEHFGRVTTKSLFHVEVQTEDRDLVTLPNLYLVTHPVTVVRRSGTIVSATVSLGYDVPRGTIEAALAEAAGAAGLEEPFVHAVDLGDFAVTWRVAGLLREVNQLLSARSVLRVRVLDALHGAGVEIVSPTFMNTRAVGERRFVPPVLATEEAPAEAPGPGPEAIVFDKAEQAAALEGLRREHARLAEELDGAEAPAPERAEALERRRDALGRTIERLEERLRSEDA